MTITHKYLIWIYTCRNTPVPVEDEGAGVPLHGKVNGMANESTVDILFQLGAIQDAGTSARYARSYLDVAVSMCVTYC